MPDLLASGRDADVYAINAERVLRRYRDGSDVAAEATVMAHVRAHGLPVPAVYRASGPDLEMERLDGPTMLHALVNGGIDVRDAGVTLADLHRRLHAVPPMGAAEPGERVLHLDLHPDNVVLTGGGPVLIDWRNAADGPPDLDVALSALILAQVAVEPDHQLATVAAGLLAAFVARVDGEPGHMLERATALRAADPNLLPAERSALADASALVRSHVQEG